MPAPPVAKPAPPVARPAPVLPVAKPVPAPGNARVESWLWPTEGPVLRTFQSQSAGRKGVDIGGRAGQRVVAAADGRVVYTGSGLVGYGRLIIVKHNKNMLSAYGHNQKIMVKEGDQVRGGQAIATMGNSGTTRNQLYFEIRKDGKPVNPLLYLPKR
jgi:lipoprotein NlpD